VIYPASGDFFNLNRGAASRHRASLLSEKRGGIYARRLFTEHTEGESVKDQDVLACIAKAEVGIPLAYANLPR